MGDEEQGAPEKVSRSELANEIVAALSAVAVRVIELGNEHERALEDLKDAQQRLHDETRRANLLEQEAYVLGIDAEELEGVYGLLEDFRRGIRDCDELLEGTVGR